MMRPFDINSREMRRFRISGLVVVRQDFLALLSGLLLALGSSGFAGAPPNPAPPPEPPPPSTPREFFNAGTQMLREGKLREAEAFLESTLSSQVDSLQPPALYNLGQVRFGQGKEELKKGPPAKPTLARGRAAEQLADEAIRSANESLAGNEIERMLTSYMNGRGARKELNAAIKAVQRALEAHRATLTKWQRASDDFKSTVELKRADADAQLNAENVDRNIAKLVDSLRELQQCMNGLGQKKNELGEKMKQLKGRIPAPNMPPGAAGEDEEEEEQPLGPKPGQQEGATKEGEEMKLSREQAGWLLDAFKLDSERRLPMGEKDTGERKNPWRRTW